MSLHSFKGNDKRNICAMSVVYQIDTDQTDRQKLITIKYSKIKKNAIPLTTTSHSSVKTLITSYSGG